MKNYLELSDIIGVPSLDQELLQLAERERRLRKRRGLSQMALSEKSGVSLGSIKRFERTGEISLKHLFQIALALDDLASLREVFNNVPMTRAELWGE